MGNAIRRVTGHAVKRPIQRYNAEERAHKVLDSFETKAVPAPKHEVDKIQLEHLRKTRPDIREATINKDDELAKRLKDVYVTSRDPASFDPDALKQPENPDRPLPRKAPFAFRDPTEMDAFGVKDLKPARGKINLEAAQEMITLHQKDRTKYTAKYLADKYDVAERTVASTLHYFFVFNLHENEEVGSATARNDPYVAHPSWVDSRLEQSESVEAKKIPAGMTKTPIVNKKALPEKSDS